MVIHSLLDKHNPVPTASLEDIEMTIQFNAKQAFEMITNEEEMIQFLRAVADDLMAEIQDSDIFEHPTMSFSEKMELMNELTARNLAMIHSIDDMRITMEFEPGFAHLRELSKQINIVDYKLRDISKNIGRVDYQLHDLRSA